MLEKTIRAKMNDAGYRLTSQRRAVLTVMQEHPGEHLTAEEVLMAARRYAPNLGIATVYRTLEKLSSLDILYKMAFDDSKYRYEMAVDEPHRHHHIVCPRCARITEVGEDLLHPLEQHLEAQGYRVVNHQLKIYAYCPGCN
ncbi:MAG: Fur family transcriptional regulator [Syntrophomonadaceae bacterium]|nr:Fur family transcriptional regulator [Syntrophomonadaceae bacterium]